MNPPGNPTPGPARPPPPLPARLILYDGVCGFCNRAVERVLRADAAGKFHYAPLQGPTAAAVRGRHAEIPVDSDSIVYVCSTDATERVYVRADALFRICAELPRGWRLLAWLRWLPRGCTDLGYRLFAARRYHLFGRLDACPLPPPGAAARFLP